MPILIYNTLKREKEEFKPIKKGKIGMYVCGPTVYDEPHIGHARSAYIFDVVRRYLEYRKFKVTFVRNVTDVDDKIIQKAKEEFPDEDLNNAVKKVSEKYLKSYHDDMDVLGIDRPDKEPKATEYINKMVIFIKHMIARDVAYVSGGDVYFDIRKAKDYGKLSNQSIDKMEAGARVSPDDNKRDPLDFALWKAAKEGEPSWPSPWGKGRPGWHIECSVMSSDILGDEFDIHAGGIDLIFPHHENEIAQSKGAGKKFARYWMHNGLLTINGEKMAKSLGNCLTIDDFINKHKNINILKFFFLSTHYSHPIDYNEEKILEAKKTQERLSIMLNNIDRIANIKLIKQNLTKNNTKFEYIRTQFIEAMDDDFNMPRALAVLHKLIIETNIVLTEYNQLTNHEISLEQLSFSRFTLLPELAGIFGLDLNFSKAAIENIENDIKVLIEKRKQAREKKDFETSDNIRKQLDAKGIILEDNKDGTTTWRRKL